MTGRARSRQAGLLAFFVASLSQQVAGQSLSLDPPRLEVSVKAGEEATESLLVRNGGRKAVSIRISLEPFALTEDGSVESGKASTGPHDATGWVRVNPTSLEIEPGETEVVRLTVRAPGTAHGTHWTALFAETLPDAEAPPETVSIGLRLGSYLYVSVGKGEKPAADLTLSSGAAAPEFRAEVVHRSGGIIRLDGEWRLLDTKGAVLRKERLAFPLFPGAKRALHWKPSELSSKAVGRVELRLTGPGVKLMRGAAVGVEQDRSK